MERIRNLSVRKTIILYMAVSLAASFFLSAVISKGAERLQNRIWWKYVDEERYFELAEGDGIGYMVDVPRPSGSEMSRMDYEISETCDFLQTYTVLLLSVAGSFLAVYLFYRHKLEIPLRELVSASKRIRDNDLDFSIEYKNQDEMGQLCHEFERMRAELFQNNQRLWRTLEEERKMRAAVAHDIRSPLSVLKGYQEMLITYLPEGTLSIEKAEEMLTESMKQIRRMDTFIETMRKLNSLEERPLLLWDIGAGELKKDISAELDILAADGSKRVTLEVPDTEEKFTGDKEIILEVAENLISNALRYADEAVEIKAVLTEKELRLCVRDDGCGFSGDTKELTKAFHRQDIKDSLKHAGLGMYISRLYCEKHGGYLCLENDEQGGAVVTAAFSFILK